jgi:hypothetical protein
MIKSGANLMPKTIGSRTVRKAQNFKKAPEQTKSIRVIKGYRNLFLIVMPLMVLAFHIWPCVVIANDHKGDRSHFKQYESGKDGSDSKNRKGERLKNEDEGNELTGLTAAWLLAAANLTVFLSILLKGAIHYLPLKPGTKNAIKRINQFQKKHLMRFHFLLNPLALCTGVLHFLLSCCRKTTFPEWGLLFVAMMVFLGLMVKFKGPPKWMRKFLYRLHTSRTAFSALILMLVVGHLMVE